MVKGEILEARKGDTALVQVRAESHLDECDECSITVNEMGAV